MNSDDLIGKQYHFDDGSVLTIMQIKQKEIHNETVPFLTYTVQQGRNSIPRKLVMPLSDFMSTFGHLFNT